MSTTNWHTGSYHGYISPGQRHLVHAFELGSPNSRHYRRLLSALLSLLPDPFRWLRRLCNHHCPSKHSPQRQCHREGKDRRGLSKLGHSYRWTDLRYDIPPTWPWQALLHTYSWSTGAVLEVVSISKSLFAVKLSNDS